MTPDGDCLTALVFNAGISAQAAIKRNALSLVFCGGSPYREQAPGTGARRHPGASIRPDFEHRY